MHSKQRPPFRGQERQAWMTRCRACLRLSGCEIKRSTGSDIDRCCLCTSGRSDRGVAQVSELYQREVLEWDVVQRGLYRSFTGIFRTPVRDTVLSSWVHLIWLPSEMSRRHLRKRVGYALS